MDLGDRISVKRNGTSLEGVLMPSRREGYLVIKLDNGYNIGLCAAKCELTLLQKHPE
ncbi:MAG: Glu-tRNA(Gln) amidotransferase GatDE subunit D, partial [Methanothrix sp.]